MNAPQIKNPLPLGTILKGKSYNYRIEKALGQGSFGITYMVSVKMQGALGEIDSSIHVAIKEFFMKETNGRNGSTVTSGSKGGLFDKYRVKFAREAENLSRLHHPNIVKVLESFEANNTVYYAMEYIDGGSLNNHILQNKSLSEKESIRYLKQIGEALSYMHHNKMLHLDLKPDNIVLRKNGEAVLIDFGLAKQYDDNGKPETSTSVGGGTTGYAPVEQANYKDGHGFPVTMDVYALGATMFKMLTGVRPPDASDILNEGFPVYELQSHNVSDLLISVIAKAMAPLKKNRYQNVEQFIAALDDEGTKYEETEDTVLEIVPQKQPDFVQLKTKEKDNVKTEKRELNALPFSNRCKCIILTHEHIGTMLHDITTFTYKITPSILEITFKRADDIFNNYSKKIQISKSKYETLLNRLMEEQYYQTPTHKNILMPDFEKYDIKAYSSTQIGQHNLIYKGKFEAPTFEFEKNSIYMSWKNVESLIRNIDSGFNAWINSSIKKIEKKNTSGIYFANETPESLISKHGIRKIVIRVNNYEAKECQYIATLNSCEFFYKTNNKTQYRSYVPYWDNFNFKKILKDFIDLKLTKKYTDSNFSTTSRDYVQILMYANEKDERTPLINIWCREVEYAVYSSNVVATPIGLYNQIKHFYLWESLYTTCVKQQNETEKITKTVKEEIKSAPNNISQPSKEEKKDKPRWGLLILIIIGILSIVFCAFHNKNNNLKLVHCLAFFMGLCMIAYGSKLPRIGGFILLYVPIIIFILQKLFLI